MELPSNRKKRYTCLMNYTIVIHQDPDRGCWAEVPALPGCVSQGDTLAVLKNNVREAIEGYLAVMHEDGRQPEPNVQLAEVAV